MQEPSKTNQELIEEISLLNQRIQELEHSSSVRKQAEEASKKSEVKFKFFIDNAIEALYLHEMSGEIIDVNETAVNDSGYSRDELLQLTAFDIDPSLCNYENRSEIWKNLPSSQYQIFYSKHKHKNGSLYPIEVKVGKILLEGKEYMLSLAHDITDHKHLESRFMILFEGSSQGILAFDLETGRFAFANPSFCRMLGYSEPELLQLSIADIHPKDSLEHIMIEFESLKQGEKKLSSALPCLRKDSAVFYADITATGTLIINDRRYLVAFFADVTERKRAEEELKSYAAELEDTNTALRVFMNRRDHDQKMLEERLQINVEEIVVPYLRKLNATKLDSRQKKYLGVLESNLNNIVSPYMANLSVTYKKLTPQEIQIANLIRQGMNTKDIAEMLCISVHTINTH